MAVTKSWTKLGMAPATIAAGRARTPYRGKIRWLAAASLLAAAALAMVYAAKTQNFAADEDRLSRGELVNLNALPAPGELAPVLQTLPEPDVLAKNLSDFARSHPQLKNVGAAARAAGSRRTFGRLKPLLVVRTPGEFRRLFFTSIALYFAGFYLVAFVWRRTGF